MNLSAFEKYKIATVKTSDTVGQLLFIFDEFIKLFYKARKALEENQHEAKHKALVIVVEVAMVLRSGVDVEADELLQKLDNFYKSMIQASHNLNVNAKSPEEFDVLIESMKQVRDSLLEAQAEEVTS